MNVKSSNSEVCDLQCVFCSIPDTSIRTTLSVFVGMYFDPSNVHFSSSTTFQLCASFSGSSILPIENPPQTSIGPVMISGKCSSNTVGRYVALSLTTTSAAAIQLSACEVVVNGSYRGGKQQVLQIHSVTWYASVPSTPAGIYRCYLTCLEPSSSTLYVASLSEYDIMRNEDISLYLSCSYHSVCRLYFIHQNGLPYFHLEQSACHQRFQTCRITSRTIGERIVRTRSPFYCRASFRHSTINTWWHCSPPTGRNRF